jgi:hypothetical protein
MHGGAKMNPDIRDKATLDHTDVRALNFIRADLPYRLRRHYRHGLRSHILEILDPADVAREQAGILVDGLRCFPRARPRRMFRIFRSRLGSLDSALKEIGRVKIVERYLAPDLMATSVEVLVDYQGPAGRDLILCGFQEYVDGVVIDPWTLLDSGELLAELYRQVASRAMGAPLPEPAWIEALTQQAVEFGQRIRRMMTESRHIPDLAGAGNLMVTPRGGIRLVDINNISPVTFGARIDLDEKGYPVCDKSVEALALIEEKLTGRPVDRNAPVYRHFFAPQRRRAVAEQEQRFWQAFSAGREPPSG